MVFRATGASWGIALLCIAGNANANVVTLDNGVAGVGHLDLTCDDYGSFGRWIGPNDCDNFWPPNYQRADPMSNVVESLLFISAAGHQGGVALTGHPILQRLLEGPQADGLEGDFANLTRTVTTSITATGGVATSAFTVADSATSTKLDIALSQQLVVETSPATRLEQDFTITNSGTSTVTLVWHAIWDMNCLYADANADTDYVGVGQGLCYVYMHDPGSTTQGGAFADGGSEIGVPGALSPLPRSGYYGAKDGVMPEDTLLPAFNVPTSLVANQHVWLGYGMPDTWVNEVAKVGKNTAGESNVSAPTAVGMEYRFTLAPAQVAVIRLRRHWGTVALPCNTVSASCGNGMVDSGEPCDSATDTPTCNANMCTPATCGDNYINTAANEECESNGMNSVECNGLACTRPACGDGYFNDVAGEACDDGADTETCNLANCQPPACGDGIVNAVAGEECDGGPLCDPASCTLTFTVGGGCAGCASNRSGGTLTLAVVVIAFAAGRRRRRAYKPNVPRRRN